MWKGKLMSDRHDLVPAIEAATVTSGLRLWWFGGPSYVIRSPRTIVYVDPFHGGEGHDVARGFDRVIPNVFFPQDVTRADLVLSTHDHLDHCDPDTLGPLCARTQARIVAAPSSATKMAGWDFTTGRVDVLQPGGTLQFNDVSLTAYQSNDWDDTEAITLVLSAAGRTVFIGGDTMYFDALEEIGRAHSIDLAILALARNRPDLIDRQLYFTPEELARAALALKARQVAPFHWDIWKGWLEDPHRVAPYLAGTPTELVLLAQGESLDV